MSEISFQEEGGFRAKQQPRKRSLSDWLVAKGIAPNPAVANLILLGVAIVAVILAIYLQSTSSTKGPIKTKEQLIQEGTWPDASKPLPKPKPKK